MCVRYGVRARQIDPACPCQTPVVLQPTPARGATCLPATASMHPVTVREQVLPEVSSRKCRNRSVTRPTHGRRARVVGTVWPVQTGGPAREGELHDRWDEAATDTDAA